MDKQKADSIITEYFHPIYGYAVKKSFSYDEAEDLCAEIVKEVYLSLLKAKEISNPEAYIRRVSQHTYSKYVSSKKRRREVSLDGDLLSPPPEIPYYENYDAFSEDAEDELRRLRWEIAFLTRQRREIVWLFYYRNISIADISRRLNMPEGTVKWHLNKARKDLKEGFTMERTIGKLGLDPVTATGFGHSGDPGNGAPGFYLGDKLSLNLVYSVYFTPRTTEEIATELGITPVFIEGRIKYLEKNGFLVKTAGNRYTTYVKFSPLTYSCEQEEHRLKTQLKIAELLAAEYAPLVREAIADVTDVYIPGGNRELLDAAAIVYGIANKSRPVVDTDLSKYRIRTSTGGDYIAIVHLQASRSDPDYEPTIDSSYWCCGDMNRYSEKYPAIQAWAMDNKYCSRQGKWQNNLSSDYEYLYEFLLGALADIPANEEKYRRLRSRHYLTEDNQVNIMLVKGNPCKFFQKIPSLPEHLMEKYARYALEAAMEDAKAYPPQMQDLVVSWSANGLIGTTVAVMVMDILYGNGTFKPLTDSEKVTSQLIMFSDILP